MFSSAREWNTVSDTVPDLRPVRRGGPTLVCAISGLGKTTLAGEHPGVVYDADQLIYDAVERGFPELPPRARLRAWRDLVRHEPWREGGEPLERWATTRRALIEPFIDLMWQDRYRLVVTSFLRPPWFVSAYYAIGRGCYLDHLRRAGCPVDNDHSEAMNDRFEGYAPLARLPPGQYLGQRAEILALLETRAGGI